MDASLLARLSGQLEGFFALTGGVDPELASDPPASGKWSARENLAHLARHHEVLLARIDRILREERPTLPRYRAEEDPDWSGWSRRSTEEVLSRLRSLRERLLEVVRGLSDAELARCGLHSALGELSLRQWLDFFLIHEAHHLYLTLTLLKEARDRRASGR